MASGLGIGVSFEVTFDMGDLSARLEKAALESLDQICDVVEENWRTWIGPWRHKPGIFREISGHEADVGMNDQVAWWLVHGTAVKKYRPGPKGWVNKTFVRSLQSRPGGGDFVWGGGKEWPGIPAREADQVNAEETQKVAGDIARAVYAAVLG